MTSLLTPILEQNAGPAPGIDEDVEPDTQWKESLRTRIEKELQSMADKVRQDRDGQLRGAAEGSPFYESVMKTYNAAMDRVRRLAQEQFNHELKIERFERSLALGKEIEGEEFEAFRRQQQAIWEAIKKGGSERPPGRRDSNVGASPSQENGDPVAPPPPPSSSVHGASGEQAAPREGPSNPYREPRPLARAPPPSEPRPRDRTQSGGSEQIPGTPSSYAARPVRSRGNSVFADFDPTASPSSPYDSGSIGRQGASSLSRTRPQNIWLPRDSPAPTSRTLAHAATTASPVSPNVRDGPPNDGGRTVSRAASIRSTERPSPVADFEPGSSLPRDRFNMGDERSGSRKGKEPERPDHQRQPSFTQTTSVHDIYARRPESRMTMPITPSRPSEEQYFPQISPVNPRYRPDLDDGDGIPIRSSRRSVTSEGSPENMRYGPAGPGSARPIPPKQRSYTADFDAWSPQPAPVPRPYYGPQSPPPPTASSSSRPIPRPSTSDDDARRNSPSGAWNGSQSPPSALPFSGYDIPFSQSPRPRFASSPASSVSGGGGGRRNSNGSRSLRSRSSRQEFWGPADVSQRPLQTFEEQSVASGSDSGEEDYGMGLDDLWHCRERQELRDREVRDRQQLAWKLVLQAEEARRMEEEAHRKQEEAARKEAEARRKEEEARQKEEEARRKEEEVRLQALQIQQKQEELLRREADLLRREVEAKLQEEIRKREEAEARLQEEIRRRKEAEELQKREREEAEKRAREQRERDEFERRQREEREREREERERRARDEREKEERERKEKEDKARKEREERERKEKEKEERERKQREREERERERRERQEKERIEQEKERSEREKRKQEEAKKRQQEREEAERRAQEEYERSAWQKRQREEEERLAQEKREWEDTRRREAEAAAAAAAQAQMESERLRAEAAAAAEAEAQRIAQEQVQSEARRRGDAKKQKEAERRREAEAKRREEAEAKRRQEEEAQRQLEEEAQRRREEAERKREEELQRERQEEEARKRRDAEELQRRRDEEARRRRAEEEAQRQRDEEAARQQEEEARRREAEEAQAHAISMEQASRDEPESPIVDGIGYLNDPQFVREQQVELERIQAQRQRQAQLREQEAARRNEATFAQFQREQEELYKRKQLEEQGRLRELEARRRAEDEMRRKAEQAKQREDAILAEVLRKSKEETRNQADRHYTERRRQDSVGSGSDSNRPGVYYSASSTPRPIPNPNGSLHSSTPGDRSSTTSSSSANSSASFFSASSARSGSTGYTSSASRASTTSTASATPTAMPASPSFPATPKTGWKSSPSPATPSPTTASSTRSTGGAYQTAYGPYTQSSASAARPAASQPATPSAGEQEWFRRQEEQARRQFEQFQRDQEAQQRRLEQKAMRQLSKEDVIKLFEEHERRWGRLMTMDVLSWHSFPWPMLKQPNEPEQLTYIEIQAYVLSPHQLGDKTPKERIKDYLRKWHPDRFETKVLPKVREDDREKVQEGAGTVARHLNKLLSSLSGSAENGLFG